MSRIGKKPVEVPSGVEIKLDGNTINVKGPKGQRSFDAPGDVVVAMEDGAVTVQPANDTKRARQMWGMSRTQVENCIRGVSEGFTRKLAIQGVGYRAQAQGKTLKLSLGYSHDIDFDIPDGIEVKTPKPTEIEVTGIDQQLVGQVAANIREWRKPEPYKGKGIRYEDEYIFRKEGKKK
jgi:large subunit ribosomal protein L6